MILRPEKKEIIKIKTGLCYREVLLHKDRFQPFAWNLYSFHSPSFIQEPQIVEVVLHFELPCLQSRVCLGCACAPHYKQMGWRVRGWC